MDFDFFSAVKFDNQDLIESIPFLKKSKVIQNLENTLTCLVGKEEIPISFFCVTRAAKISHDNIVSKNHIHVATLIDMAAFKCVTIQQRAQAKDYLDLYFIITQANITLLKMFNHARKIFGSGFNHELTLKALSYYDDGNLRKIPAKVKKLLVSKVIEFAEN